MAFTPLIDTGGVDVEADDVENPSIAVSNDGTNWFPPSVIKAGLTNPIVDKDDVGGGATVADFLSDPDLIMASDSSLWCVFRATFGDPTTDSIGLYVMRLDPTDTLFDTAVRIITSTTNSLASPSIILESNRSYALFCVDFIGVGGDSSVVDKFVTTLSPDSTWTFADTTNFTATQDTTMTWHIEVISNGPDELIVLSVERGGSTAPYRLYIGKSIDGGANWVIDSGALLLPSGLTNAWDETSIYRASGVWVEDGRGQYLDMFYSAIGGTGPDEWATGRTSVFFNDTTTYVVPHTDTVDYMITALGDAIGEDSTANTLLMLKGADFTAMTGLVGPVPYTRDSITTGTNVESQFMYEFVTEANTIDIDSALIIYKTRSATTSLNVIDSFLVFGPTLDNTGDTLDFIPDSLWYGVNMNSASVNWAKFNRGIVLSPDAGYSGDLGNAPVNIVIWIEADAGYYVDIQRVDLWCRKTVVVQ